MKKFLTIVLVIMLSAITFGQAYPFDTVIHNGGTSKDKAYDIVVDDDGNQYVSGTFQNTVDFGSGVSITSNGNADAFIAKYDADGNILWAKGFGGDGYNTDYTNAVAVDDDGNVITASNFGGTIVLGTDTLVSTGNWDIAVVKYDASGNYLWSKQAFSKNRKQDKPTDLKIDSQGNYVLTGYYGGNAVDTLIYESLEIESHGGRDVFVIKMSSDGTPIWGVTAGGADKEESKALGIDENDNIYITGLFNSANSIFGTTTLTNVDGYDVFVAKLNSSGDYQWAISATGTGSDIGYALEVISIGGKETPTFGAIKKVNDNSAPMLLVAGSFSDSLEYNAEQDPLESVGKKDMFVLGVDSETGAVDIGLQFGGTEDDEAKAVNFIAGSDGAWYLSGISYSDMVFPNSTITNKGKKDVVIFRMNQENLDWVKNYGGSSDDYLNCSTVGKDEDIYFAGAYTSTTVDFEPFNFGTNGSYDIWFGKMHEKYATVLFVCDMSVQIDNGAFNPETDSLFVRGSFQTDAGDTANWQGNMFRLAEDKHGSGKSIQSDENGSIYSAQVSLPADSAGKTYEYKFVMNETLETVDSRTFVLESPLTWTTPVRFNDDNGGGVNQASVIRFIVDMNGAVDGNGTAFSSIENVVIAGANTPLAWPDGGWPDADSTKVFFMSDDGTNGDETAGDNFWTTEINFPIYSPLDIEYKYGANWGLASNGGANDNEGGVGSNHHVTLFPEFTYGNAIDVFGTFETKDIDTRVTETGEIPTVYALGQNYPNPFNPSTVIKFSIPNSGLVSLKVFNILGQEVATLVNEMKSVGVYEVSFDASSLTTGMYIYRIQSGDFTSTKKMLLLK